MEQSAKAVLEGAGRRSSSELKLLRPATASELLEFERELGMAAPADMRELLLFAAGLEHPSIGRVDFLGRGLSVQTPFRSLPIAGDGFGNFWVVDAPAKPGNGDAVIFWSHDPPVAVLQSPTLAAFLRQVLDGGPNEVNELAHRHALRMWSNDPDVVSVQEARRSVDPILRAFAESLPDSFAVVDLRQHLPGSGFSWGRSDLEPVRQGDELLFGLEMRKGFWKRLLGKFHGLE